MTERYTCAQEEERRNYVKNCFEHKWTHDFRPIHGALAMIIFESSSLFLRPQHQPQN